MMTCDLVGSPALSALDPEDMGAVMDAFQATCARITLAFDGFLADFRGDGILAYFGYPRAHEDDAERTVRAALDIVSAVARLKTRAQEPLSVRIGIATGLVVVGGLGGAGRDQGVVGEIPNLAARLQEIAEPNMVVIADGTRRLLGNLFELHDLGARYLKGMAAPMRAWAPLRATSVESRFEALHASGLTALVGREEESDLLLRRWSKAKTGEGQVVLLSGEAGIGKSRLTVALLERLATEPHTRLRYFCSPQHSDSALFPVIGQMERAPDWRLTTPHKQSSTSSTLFWRRPQRPLRTPCFLPRCSHLQTMGATPRCRQSRSSAGEEHSKRSSGKSRRWHVRNRC